MGTKYKVIKKTGSTCMLRKEDLGHGQVTVPLGDMPGLCVLGDVLEYH